ncbi:Ankyrin repeats (3 copies) [Rubripirellula lacrimiformis]|uniref:Ankyrin repeats (3 copies) n=1 Tax=Rubripirellula lacrimiformis TaxID=1930273 RepID=A0A517NLJ9_9BACT|nr:ankyrin repeat domain-containing protein [Rubripirellula lacrimiformis]QDT08017.1 Ankyrin repeats (3 copies) [Rubripirellula lacrimiformis]
MGTQRNRKAHSYVVRNNRKRLRHLLGKHPELRTSCEAWIVAAAVLNNPGILTWLFQRGVSPDSRLSANGDTPLMLAVSLGDLPVMRTLLEHGADPNAENSDGDNAFLRAIREKQADAMRLLAEFGADFNHLDDSELWYIRDTNWSEGLAVLSELQITLPTSP